MTALEAARAARLAVDGAIEAQRAAVETQAARALSERVRFSAAWRALMVSDRVWPGLYGGGSRWRFDIDQACGRFAPHVRR